VTEDFGFYFGQPWWLLSSIVIVPMVWLARRNLTALGALRRAVALVLRIAVVLLLVLLLARPTLVQKNHRATVIVVMDRSQSIPQRLRQAALDYLSKAVTAKRVQDRLAVVDVAEAARISKLPSDDVVFGQRNTQLIGSQSRLANGIEMAMAIAPPDTATRIILVSEGNETEGDLKQTAQTAAANKIPIDVLPLRYRYDKEVVFKRLAAPSWARSGQTISLRFLLDSTAAVSGQLLLTLNDKPIDLAPGDPGVTTVSLPIGSSGMHKFDAVFVPADSSQDRIAENNRATATTQVAGPGRVVVVDEDGTASQAVLAALRSTDMDVQYLPAAAVPDNLALLLGTDAVLLVDTSSAAFTFAQQEMLARYVNDLGGGLIMIGGPNSFGAGGWIGSPVADVLPVDLDPPQKKQMPRGALCLVIDRSGSMTGLKLQICKVAAAAAVRLLSKLDLVGVVTFDAVSEWWVPFGSAEDKAAICGSIDGIHAGGGTIMGPAMQMALEAMSGADAAIKHVILLTDGQTSDRDVCAKMSAELTAGKITVSTVAVGDGADTALLYGIATATQGRFYHTTDPMQIPEIFVKEAQVVRRAMIVEQTFSPQIVYSLSEALKGIPSSLPALDGYVLTGPKGGLNQVVVTSHESDPILATCQSGLGRCVAFTSSADSRWAAKWVQWSGFARFWEQVVRWAGKPSQSPECEIFADIQGEEVTVRVEASDAQGRFVQFAGVEGRVFTPDMKSEPLSLTQTGPGQYAGRFMASASGSYVINVKYRRSGDDDKAGLSNAVVTVPFAAEFRHLSDNAPLLEQVSHITEGRILPSDPNQANLYDYSGLTFPQTHLPLLQPLMLLWIALFLLDVAVRRVVIDVRASLRRVRAWILSAAQRRTEDETIERLSSRRRKLREQWAARSARISISKHYDGAQDYQGDLLGEQPRKAAETHQVQQATGTDSDTRSGQPRGAASTHIDQLLKAKRKATARNDGPESRSGS
jgi:Ca-activated chloride channel family protein